MATQRIELPDLREGLRVGLRWVRRLMRRLVLRWVLSGLALATFTGAGAQPAGDTPMLSSVARQLVRAVLATSDHRTLPFLVLDKQRALLWVLDPAGRVVNASPVLLGLARGDDSVPGIGDRPLRSGAAA